MSALSTRDRDPAWLSRTAGVPPATLSDYIRRGISNVGAGVRIAEALEVSLDWLLTGKGDAAASSSAGDEDLIWLPMAGAKLSAGPGAAASAKYAQSEWSFSRRFLQQSFGRVTGLELMQVRGDSQVPDLHENDWVMIDTSRTELRDGLYALLLDDEDLLLKRVQVEGRYIRLLSRNEGYAPIVIDKQDEGRKLDLLGRVVWSSSVHERR